MVQPPSEDSNSIVTEISEEDEKSSKVSTDSDIKTQKYRLKKTPSAKLLAEDLPIEKPRIRR